MINANIASENSTSYNIIMKIKIRMKYLEMINYSIMVMKHTNMHIFIHTVDTYNNHTYTYMHAYNHTYIRTYMYAYSRQIEATRNHEMRWEIIICR